MAVWGIILAGGKSEELAPGIDVAFLPVGKRPVLAYSLLRFEHCSEIDQCLIVVAKQNLERTLTLVKRLGTSKVRHIVAAGRSRAETLRTALEKIDGRAFCVAIHEASRPAFSESVLAETVKTAKRYGAATAAYALPEAVKLANGRKVAKTLERGKCHVVQTPQAFKTELLERALESARKKKLRFADDESFLLESFRKEVRLVESDYRENVKIATSDDLSLLTALMMRNEDRFFA